MFCELFSITVAHFNYSGSFWPERHTLSRRRAVVLGGGHSTSFWTQRSSKNLRVSVNKHEFLREKLFFKNFHVVVQQIFFCLLTLTITVVGVRSWKLHSQFLLQVFNHADPSEGRSEVNFMGLSLWTIRMIHHLITSGNVLHHSCESNKETSLGAFKHNVIQINGFELKG